jgi:hypothetical protein
MSPGPRRFSVPFRVERPFCASQVSVGLCLSHLGRFGSRLPTEGWDGNSKLCDHQPHKEGRRQGKSDDMKAHRKRLSLPRALPRMASVHRRLQSVPSATPRNLRPPGVSEPRAEHRVLGLALPGPRFSRPKLSGPISSFSPVAQAATRCPTRTVRTAQLRGRLVTNVSANRGGR